MKELTCGLYVNEVSEFRTHITGLRYHNVRHAMKRNELRGWASES